MLSDLFARLEQLYPELVKIRRDLHMYPELSYQEVNTPQKVADYLRALGLEVRTEVGGRGVVGLLRGGKPGKTIALRADFDALPIQDEKQVEYKSRVPGVMHACGHDIHTSALLGAAHVLSEVREQVPGNVVFLHQFAEEMPPGGAKAMIEDGCLDGVDEVYGAHVWSTEPYGTIGVTDGYTMAAGDGFEIDISGKGGHGGQPHLTIDPLVVGCQLVVNLQQIVSRRVDPIEPVVLSVGSIHSGLAANVIPDTCHINGNVRTFNQEVRGFVEQQIHQITEATCEAAGAVGTVRYRSGYDAVWNHPEQTQAVRRLFQHLIGEENVKSLDPSMASEDFTYYLQKVPGTFFFVGGRNPDIGATYPHHHPMFDADERAILLIGKAFLSIVLGGDASSFPEPIESATAQG
ncbi:amidohydrolase [Brevibacillus nitrificans]|uniref:M20 metallopeptidase family protein n=1 Tax=Brevibacillus nitrificans TaxID=651560 RepID=UPI002858397A|nr:amidohydrolase [Brevibacillus nitrificans]MDR7317580.1 amidohydrolase [Brevibacillus nitrificans]